MDLYRDTHEVTFADSSEGPFNLVNFVWQQLVLKTYLTRISTELDVLQLLTTKPLLFQYWILDVLTTLKQIHNLTNVRYTSKLI